MGNQREIAAKLGLSQTTVSLALRGHPKISAEIRAKALETARMLNYQPNAYVNVLMERIRSGKMPSEKGVIAMLVDSPSEKTWHLVESFKKFHEGVLRRSEELGFRVESFFLREPDANVARIESILRARGIQGIILSPPYRGNRSLDLRWERYASVGVGFGWEEQELDRVAYDNYNNYLIAFNALRQLGYKQIGTILNQPFTEGTCHGIKWFTGYLECQERIPQHDRVPICRTPTHANCEYTHELEAHPSCEEQSRAIFWEWFAKWRPDALLTVTGHEYKWLIDKRIKYPDDVGLACLAQPAKPEFSRVNKKGEEVGATALEWVASKIARNEYGTPKHPKVMMIEGEWVSGKTVKRLRDSLIGKL